MKKEKLSLSNICEGSVEGQFQAVYPEILKTLKEGQKAKIKIELEFVRPKGSSMMASISSKFSKTMPPMDAKIGLYPFKSDFGIDTEVPEEVNGVIQFPNALGQNR